MPLYESQIPNLESTVSKPIAIQAVEHIRDNFFPDSCTRIKMVDQTGTVIEFGSNIGASPNDIILDTEELILAQYTELAERDIILTSIVNGNEQLPVWYDDKLNVLVRPIKAQTTCTLAITYTGASKQQVDNWVNYLYTKFARGSSSLPMNFKYEVTIPESVLYVIKEVWSKREAIAGYGDSFMEYINNHLRYPYDYKTNQLGNSTTLVLREELCRVVATVEPDVPEASRSENNTYEATINFKFRYDKPASMTIDYPIFVHNQYISQKYFDSTLDRNKEMKTQYKSDYGLLHALSYLYDEQRESILSEYGYIFPAFDTFIPKYANKAIKSIIQLQLSIDINNPRVLLDLNTLAEDTGLVLHKDLITYIKDSGDAVFRYGASLVYIAIHRNGSNLNPERYTISSDGIIESTYDMNIRGDYHITISVLGDLGLLGDAGYKTLSSYGDLFRSILAIVVPTYPVGQYPDTTTASPGGYIHPMRIKNVVESLPAYHQYAGPYRNWYLVNTIAVLSK